nr:PKD domain-containing protein [Bacteroidota bacterium]
MGYVIWANFEADPTSGVAPLTVQFTDLSEGNPTSWQWDFDNDGNIDSEEQNPEWTYHIAGIYSVSLTISDGELEDTIVKENVIHAYFECDPVAVYAGIDGNICENELFQLNASGTNFESLLWESTGDGAFSNSQILNPEYFPGPNDISNGVVQLCITGFAAEPCPDSTDCLMLTIQGLPFAHAGTDNTIPEGELYIFNDAFATNFTAVQWATTNGAGIFSNETILNPTYYPSPLDWALQYIEFVLVISSVNPCQTSYQDFIHISFTNQCQDAMVDAGDDIDIFSTDPSVQMNATTSFFKDLTWLTTGDGTFDFANTLNPYYTPGNSDIEAEEVKLFLSVAAYSSCEDAIDSVMIFIEPALPFDLGNE